MTTRPPKRSKRRITDRLYRRMTANPDARIPFWVDMDKISRTFPA